jgi:hypothetical protein
VEEAEGKRTDSGPLTANRAAGGWKAGSAFKNEWHVEETRGAWSKKYLRRGGHKNQLTICA